ANRDAYRVVTPFATIGIRGTDHEEVITPDGLLTGVFGGGITVENSAGSLNLGLGGSYDYALVGSNSTPPRGLTQQPPGLRGIPILDDNEEGTEDGDDDDSGDEGGGPLPVVPLN